MDQDKSVIASAQLKKLEASFNEGNRQKKKNSAIAGFSTGVIMAGVCVLVAPAPTLGIMAASGVGSILASGLGYRFTKGKEDAQQALNTEILEHISRLIANLTSVEKGTKIDFIFNLESSLYPKYKKIPISQIGLKASGENKNKILPLNMAKYYIKIGKTFRELFDKEPNNRPFVEQIIINNAEMTDEQFEHLLEYDLGCCGTRKLDLSKNRLTTLSIQNLRDVVVKNKSFQNVKSLNLSHNNLSHHSLGQLIGIIEHLGIEELDLSGNDLNGTTENANSINPDLMNFLSNLSGRMSSLKVLKIADIGLTDNFTDKLKDVLKSPTILKHLDIREHPHLRLVKLQNLIDEGLELNQSIREFLVDNQADLDLEPTFKKKDELYEKMSTLENQNCPKEAPRIVFLLNRFIQKRDEKSKNKRNFKTKNEGGLSDDMRTQLNRMMELGLSNEVRDNLGGITRGISDIRIKTFKIKKDFSIPITEKEFVMYMSNKLENYYLHAISKRDWVDLDSRLYKNIKPSDSSQPRAKTSYDLDIEEREVAKHTTLAGRKRPGISKAF